MFKSLSLFHRILIGSILCAQLFVLPSSLAATPMMVDDELIAIQDDHTLFAPIAFQYEQRYNVPSTLFGVQLYGNSHSSVAYFQDLLDSQASWARNELSWT